MRPDAAQLAELARDWPEINHLYMVENFLRRLVPQEMVAQCELSLTLTDTGAIMLVLEAVQQQHSGACQAAAMEVAERINTPSNDAVKPVVRTARLLGSLGGNVVGNSVKGQMDIITGDIQKMKSDTTSKVTGTYNGNLKKVESYASSGRALLAPVSTVLATMLAALAIL